MSRSFQCGMTLLEIALSLLILGVVFGTAIPLSMELFNRHPLEDHVNEFSDFIQISMIESAERRQTRIFRFEEDRIIASQFYVEAKGPDLGFFNQTIDEETEESTKKDDNVLLLPEETKYVIRLWPSDQWLKPEGQAWRIPPDGLILPLSIKWEAGESWMAASIDPLTGALSDVTFELR